MPEETFDNTWPKSTRLNKDNRDKFVRTVLEDLMPGDKEPDLSAFCKGWGDKVYEACYRQHREQMDALPDWMWVKNTGFHVDVWKYESKTDPIVKTNNGVVEFEMSKPRKMTNEKYSSYSWSSTANHLAELPEGHEVIQAYKDHCQALEDWKASRRELTTTLQEVVEACNTSHQLFRAWPKAVKYAAECFPYVEPSEAKRGGQTNVSAEQLDLTAKLAQVTIGVVEQN